MEDRVAPKVLAILGPTGVGKTRTALQVCRELEGEIVVCDSRQVYRGLDIGTAKPTAAEQAKVRHHLLDVVDLGSDFSAHQYRLLAVAAIDDILRRGRVPVVVGGTGLYFKSLADGLFETPPKDESLRRQFGEWAELHGTRALWERLHDSDPETAGRLPPTDRRRIIRALEILASTGRSKSDLSQTGSYPRRLHSFVKVVLKLERKLLYERINDRVLRMIEAGWLEEVRGLLDTLGSCGKRLCTVMGYSDLCQVVRNELELGKAVERIQQAHRNYAKRQLTWFRGLNHAVWLDADLPDLAGRVIELYKKS